MSKAHVLWLLIMFDCNAIAQTAIITIKTRSEIIIAADSKALKNNNPDSAISVCKIRPIFNFFYGASGIISDPITRFDFNSIVDTTFSTKRTLLDNIGKVAKSVKNVLPKTLASIEQRDRIAFKKEFEKGDMVALQVFFAGIENDSLKIYKSDFQFSPRENFRVTSVDKSCIAHCEKIYFFGHDSAMLAYDDRYGKSPIETWDSYAIRLIEIAKIHHKENVGGDVDALKIPIIGSPTWIRKKFKCQY